MYKTQVFALLLTLSARELREIRKFLRSPFFNQRKDVVSLFDILVVGIRKGKVESSREKVFEKVYGKQPFEEQAFRQLLSWLQQLIEKYLACQEFFQNTLEVKMRLASVFRERDLPRHFQKAIRDVEGRLDRVQYRDADFYQRRFELEHEKYVASSIQRMTSHDFQSMADNLDLSYILRKLQQVCLIVAHQTVYHAEHEMGMFKEILDYIRQKKLTENPTVAAYLYCYNALTNPGREDYFFHFRDLLIKNNARFPLSELRNLYLLAINFCIRRLNEGHLNFAAEGLDLYKNALQSKVLLLNGILSRYTFQNIVAMGIKVEDFDWVEHFIRHYKDHLEEEYKESSYSFNMAMLAYSRKQLDKALELLQLADYKDLLLNLSAKTLAAKIYYELNELLLLDSHLQTMLVFIRRKKVIGYHRKNYLHFIRYLQKLIKGTALKKDKLQQLGKAISAEEPLTEKEWLLQMLNRV